MTEKKSPFIKAATKEKRYKGMFFGDLGTKKTRLALHFPNPIVIDMEHGTELYGDEFDFHVTHTTDADEVMAAIDWLLTNDHGYKTLIIDPITIYWAALQDKYRAFFMQHKQSGKGFKFDFYEFQIGDWTVIKAEFKRFIRKLMTLDMNVIVTAHQKKLYADGETMKVIGDTFDGEKSLGYVFDVVVQMSKKGDDFFCRAIKDRTNRLPRGEFPLSYETFEKAFGQKELNRKSESVQLATEKQIDEIRGWYLNASCPVDKVGQQTLLKRYEVATEADLTFDQAKDFIDKFEEAYNKRQKEKKDAGN